MPTRIDSGGPLGTDQIIISLYARFGSHIRSVPDATFQFFGCFIRAVPKATLFITSALPDDIGDWLLITVCLILQPICQEIQLPRIDYPKSAVIHVD